MRIELVKGESYGDYIFTGASKIIGSSSNKTARMQCKYCGIKRWVAFSHTKHPLICSCQEQIKIKKGFQIKNWIVESKAYFKNGSQFYNWRCERCGAMTVSTQKKVVSHNLRCECSNYNSVKKYIKDLEVLARRFRLVFNAKDLTLNGLKVIFRNEQWYFKDTNEPVIKTVYKLKGFKNPSFAEEVERTRKN